MINRINGTNTPTLLNMNPSPLHHKCILVEKHTGCMREQPNLRKECEMHKKRALRPQ